MNDFRSAVGQFNGFLVRQLADDFRVFIQFRVGVHNAGDIFPNRYVVGIQQVCQQSRRVIRPLASQRGGLVGGRSGDEPLGDVHERILESEDFPAQLGGKFLVYAGIPVILVGDEAFPDVRELRFPSLFL